MKTVEKYRKAYPSMTLKEAKKLVNHEKRANELRRKIQEMELKGFGPSQIELATRKMQWHYTRAERIMNRVLERERYGN